MPNLDTENIDARRRDGNEILFLERVHVCLETKANARPELQRVVKTVQSRLLRGQGKMQSMSLLNNNNNGHKPTA